MTGVRQLVIMGSGETAPTMVTIHQRLAAVLDPPVAAGEAVLLETPYGFQENAPDISARAVSYFAASVGLPVVVAPGLRRPAEPDGDTDRGLAGVQAARWLFAGPGSPSYALRQWRASALADVLTRRVERAGLTVFSSAAACTVGSHTLPVYEIYKVGAPVQWETGLDLTGRVGLPAAVIPHYDNAEGGNHDTRYCYMGERRLRELEEQLPAGTGVLGVDEHTAAVLDLERRTLQVTGRGGVTLRHRGESTVLESGRLLGLDEVAALLAGRRSGAPAARPAPAGPAADRPGGGDGAPAASLPEQVARAEAAFEQALRDRDGAAMAGCVLDLDRAIEQWAADTLQSDELTRAHAVLRGLVVRLGDAAASGLSDPSEVLAPLVEPMLVLRREQRGAGNYAVADAVRDALVTAGIEVRDRAQGTDWAIAGS